MRTIRIHVDQSLTKGGETILSLQAAVHVSKVLRLRAGDALVLFNGDGEDYTSELIAVTPREIRARILSSQAVSTESPLRITLAQALARGEKMDWIVQKATELGVARITPLLTERSAVKLDAARADKRIEHWRAVMVSACEQCGRARVPEIDAPQPLPAWLAALDASLATRLALLPDGDFAPRALGGINADTLLAVGPEGGFGQADVDALRAAGFRGLRLGPRVLRTETAGIAAIAVLQALYGDL